MTTHAYVDPTPVTDERDRAVAKRLTLMFVIASTAILLVSGLLGMVLRQSQADIVRLDDNFWYAIMTAHGLGAFVGWAAFAVMGFAYWVLTEVGFPIGRWGKLLADITFWTMVIGVAGVVVSTLFMSFAGSWVFLYPLPFESADQWSDAATGIFSFSVLLAGVSIITWCLSILAIVTGPGLHSPAKGFVRRMFTAMGFTFLWPSKFPTDRKLPYSVIPLTVIAIDMIIATLPLAVLLVAMVAQSIWPDVSVDPLLAKNVLWWFGHPVVYLLLFPAVAIYYLLVPRFSQRPLVAGNIIAVGWTIAVIANVTVWAHHMYLDYPNGVQAAINTAMMPITFALTIVSALSLYSLFFTIYRSRWTWTAASTALFLGLVSWLLAGLSGVVNATIALDAFVHNTLWIVGHFHHMALINIGIVIFAAVYAFLPRMLGRPLYSERAALWHVWITFFAGTGVSIVWLIQGLDGAPRRFAVLPGMYDALNASAIPLVLVLGLGQVLFFWNVAMTLAGRTTGASAREALAGVPVRRITSPSLQGFAIVTTIVVLTAITLGGWAIGNAGADDSAKNYIPIADTTGGGGDELGAQVFQNAGCGGCHTLQAAGSSGAVGPNLDESSLTGEQAATVIREGKNAMPAFGEQLAPEEVDAVASYVTEASAP